MPNLISLVNAFLATAGVVNLCAGTVFLIRSDAPLAGAGLTAGLVLLLASTMDRFESLKGLGMEAKTRELRKTIDEADAVVAMMKRLAEVTGASLVQLHANTGRLGGATPPKRGYELSRSVKQILEGVGSSSEGIRKALEPWAAYAALDVARDIARQFSGGVEAVVNERQDVVNRWPKPISAGDAGYLRAIDDAREAREYMNSLSSRLGLNSPVHLALELRSLASGVPSFVPESAASAFRDDVQVWAPELDYLATHLDFREPAMWISRINKVLGVKDDSGVPAR